MTTALIDAGPIVAYFDQSDNWHEDASEFIDEFSGQLVITTAVITPKHVHIILLVAAAL